MLLKQASEIEKVDKELKEILTPPLVKEVLALIPDEWLNEDIFKTSEAQRDAYALFLNTRIANSNIFVNEAINAREKLI